MLREFCFYHLRFYAGAEGSFKRRPFFGNVLRGGLGAALHQVTCVHGKGAKCRDCRLEGGCLFSRIFNPSNLSGLGPLAVGDPLPRPFIISAELDVKESNRQNSSLELDLFLVGKERDLYFPYVVYALEQMGTKGWGTNGVRYRIEKIKSYDGIGTDSVVFQKGSFGPAPFTITMSHLVEGCMNQGRMGRVDIHFLTPVRIRRFDENGERRFLHRSSFHLFFNEYQRSANNHRAVMG